MSDAAKRTLRTVVQTLVGLCVLLPSAASSSGLTATLPWAAGAVAVAGALSRLMSLPGVQALLPSWLGTGTPVNGDRALRALPGPATDAASGNATDAASGNANDTATDPVTDPAAGAASGAASDTAPAATPAAAPPHTGFGFTANTGTGTGPAPGTGHGAGADQGFPANPGYDPAEEGSGA